MNTIEMGHDNFEAGFICYYSLLFVFYLCLRRLPIIIIIIRTYHYECLLAYISFFIGNNPICKSFTDSRKNRLNHPSKHK